MLYVFQRSHTLSLLLAVGILTGCNGNHTLLNGGNERLAVPPRTISVYQLAGRLGMAVADNSSSMVTLRDSANIVMIYGDPGGQAYVNGAPVGGVGGVRPAGGILCVPEGMETDIRSAMRTGAIVNPVPSSPDRSLSSKAAGRVVLDAGHGGKDPGAISVLGVHEKAITLEATLSLADCLDNSGVAVTMTRRNDSFVELNERASIANRLAADLFVSLHADWCKDPAVRGFTVYIAPGASTKSRLLAKALERSIGTLGITSRGIREANFRVLVRTTCPAVLVELGYVSNRSEANMLSQTQYRDRLATAICRGVVDYLRLVK